MILKLRRKFILINMVLVSLVLLIVFVGIYFSTYQRLQAESMDAMNRAISRGADMPPPRLEIGGDHPPKPKPLPMFPVFCVTLNDKNEVLNVIRDDVVVSDNVVQDAVTLVLSSGRKNGDLAALGLRFLRTDTHEGTKIAFADLSSERSTLVNLRATSLSVGLGGLAAFFLISLWLARWALRPVEKAWGQQRQLVADASHELKTPITVILTNTDILLSHRQDTIHAQAKWVEYIKAEADRMKKLVDDLLFLAKSDDARVPALHSEFDFSDAVWSCLLPFESVAFERGIDLQSEIAPHVTLNGDQGQLKQLVVILLDNACKYAGEKGAITTVLKHHQDKARLTVNNSGDPIPAEHLQHLFERFYRIDKSRARSEGGYGLGLAIAKTIVEAHGGSITVASSAEAGTTFTVDLPIK